MKRYVRPYAEAKEELLRRAAERRNPFDNTVPEEAAAILNRLATLEHEAWAAAFSAPAPAYEEEARRAEAAGDAAKARANYLLAYGYYRVARYPCMSSTGKQAAYRKSQDVYLKAGRWMDPPIDRVEMPFNGRAGEGNLSVGLLRVPAASAPRPLLIAWGGIDSFKEERRTEPFLSRGIASLSIDMPGVADAPLAGSEDAERLWDAVLDWVQTEPRLDPRRVAVWGGSTGGYWAAKIAHTHRSRLAAVIEQGGPIHHAFQPEWIEQSQHGEYPFELGETLACAFGHSTFDEWVSYAPRLSLLDQGVLDQPCAPMLCINGVHDSVFPVADQHLLLEHGSPKTMRLYPSGHMGHTSETMPHMVTWLCETLGVDGDAR